MNKQILIVDDAVFIRKVTCRLLNSAGYNNIIEAETGMQALDLFKEINPDLVVLDVTMPDCDDLCVCQEMFRLNKDAKIIIYSAVTQDLVIQQAKNMGVIEYFMKPMDNKVFINAVKRALN